jgi:hypothetical protein
VRRSGRAREYAQRRENGGRAAHNGARGRPSGGRGASHPAAIGRCRDPPKRCSRLAPCLARPPQPTLRGAPAAAALGRPGARRSTTGRRRLLIPARRAATRGRRPKFETDQRSAQELSPVISLELVAAAGRLTPGAKGPGITSMTGLRRA